MDARNKKVVWTERMVHSLLDVWARYSQQLRYNRRDNPLLEKMARDLEKRGVQLTAKAVRSKIYNLTQKYRDEKKKTRTGSTTSTWKYFSQVHHIIGRYRCNAVASEESLMIIQDDPVIPPRDSPRMGLSSTSYEVGVCVRLPENSVSPVSRAPETSASSSELSEPSSPQAARRRSSSNIQSQMLAELKMSNDAICIEMAEVRKIAREQMYLEKIFIESTAKFQSEVMEYLNSNKK